MFSRHSTGDEQEGGFKLLPEKLTIEVEALLQAVYKSSLEKTDKKIEVHGMSYPKELLLCATVTPNVEGSSLPASFLLSADLENPEKMEEVFKVLVDSFGPFLDEYFANDEWQDYQVHWEKESFRNVEFYFKITRENIGHSLMADKILMSGNK